MKKKKKSTRKNQFSLTQKYIEAYDLLKRARIFFLVVTLTLLVATIIGFAFPDLFREEVLELLQKIMLEIQDKEGLDLIAHIFTNNLQASFFSIIFGILFGLFPIFASIFNGYVIGFTANLAVSQAGIGVLWRLLPHGIFEIPAILLSMSLGVYLGNRFIEEKMKVKTVLQRIAIIFGIVLILVPVIALYITVGSQIPSTDGFNLNLSTLSPDIFFSIVIVGTINILFIIGIVYVAVSFFKDKNLRKEFLDALWFFLLIVLPLLLVAGVIEGILITLLG